MSDTHKRTIQAGPTPPNHQGSRYQGQAGQDEVLINQYSIPPAASLENLLPGSKWPEPFRSLGIESLRQVLGHAGLPALPRQPDVRSISAAFEIIRKHGLLPIVELELRFVPVALAMQEPGLLIDWESFETDYHATRTAYRRADMHWSQARREHGLPDVDPQSDDQVTSLFDTYGRNNDPAIRATLSRFEDFRVHSKALGALERLRKYLRPDWVVRGRVHPVGTVTGRPTVVRYSLVNFPRRLRHLVIARPGYVLIYLDVRACDLQFLAHLSGDEALLAALRRGRDLHTLVAATVFDIDSSEVTAEDREDAKELNLAIAYGRDAYMVAKDLGITYDQAVLMIQRLETAFPMAIDFMKAVEERAVADRMSRSLLGRLMAHDSKKGERRLRRQARNWVIQSSGADILKDRLIALHDLVHQREWGDLLLPMNDGVLLEVSQDVLDEALPAIHECFADSPHLDMPLQTTIGWGRTWADAQKDMKTDTKTIINEEE